MKRYFLLKTCLLAMVLTCCPILSQAQEEKKDFVITLGDYVMSRNVTKVTLGEYMPKERNYVYKDYFLLTFNDGKTERFNVHPLVAQMFFGDLAATGIKLLDGGTQQDKLVLGGLPADLPVQIYNAAGKMLIDTRTSANRTVIGIESLPAGLYILKTKQVAIKFNKK